MKYRMSQKDFNAFEIKPNSKYSVTIGIRYNLKCFLYFSIMRYLSLIGNSLCYWMPVNNNSNIVTEKSFVVHERKCTRHIYLCMFCLMFDISLLNLHLLSSTRHFIWWWADRCKYTSKSKNFLRRSDIHSTTVKISYCPFSFRSITMS